MRRVDRSFDPVEPVPQRRVVDLGRWGDVGAEEPKVEAAEAAEGAEALALPAHGRYVRRPAVADEGGVVSVPPPVTDPQLVAAAGVGLAVLAGMTLLRRRPACPLLKRSKIIPRSSGGMPGPVSRTQIATDASASSGRIVPWMCARVAGISASTISPSSGVY